MFAVIFIYTNIETKRYTFLLFQELLKLFSVFKFSEIEAIIIRDLYNKNKAIKTKITTTAIVPQRTNFVKLFQVLLWFSLSINYFCLALNFGFVLLMM